MSRAYDTCQCSHDREAHEHFRPGTDCGACGAAECGEFRAVASSRVGTVAERLSALVTREAR